MSMHGILCCCCCCYIWLRKGRAQSHTCMFNINFAHTNVHMHICAHGGIINLYNIFFSRCKRIPLLCAHRRLEVEIFRMKKSLFIVACMDRLFICNLLPPFTPSFAAMPMQREPNSQHCRKFVVISCFMYWFFPLPSVALFFSSRAICTLRWSSNDQRKWNENELNTATHTQCF